MAELVILLFTFLAKEIRRETNKSRVSWACAEAGAGFSTAKGIVQSLLRDLGAPTSSISFESVAEGRGPWIDGRGARVLIEDHEIGEFGEVSPDVMSSFGLRVPIHAGEFDIDIISKMVKDPIH